MPAKRTDLALEAHNLYRAAQGREPAGVDVETSAEGGMAVTRITVRNRRGARALMRPEGVYITAALDPGWPARPEAIRGAAETLSGLLRPLVPEEGTVLVCGLGNRGITPDSLGPCAVAGILVTRHIVGGGGGDLGLRPVCALPTGVLGLTGIETAEVVRGVCGRVRPAAVIVIDALAALATERLGCTFQLTGTGITPGSGAGNARHALNEEALGVPVVALGMPTVIDLAALMDGAPPVRDMLVTPKDIDALIKKGAKVIAGAVNLALQPGLGYEELEGLVSP